MITPDGLRLAVALAHAVAGAELHLSTRRSEQVIVARHPAADIDPCAFRRTFLAAGPMRPDGPFAHIVSLRIGGTLERLGGALFRSVTPCGLHQRWLASTLPWPDLRTALLEASGDEIPDASMEASIKPDEPLGVSIIAVTATDPLFVSTLDRLGSDLNESVVAAELVRSLTRQTHPTTSKRDLS